VSAAVAELVATASAAAAETVVVDAAEDIPPTAFLPAARQAIADGQGNPAEEKGSLGFYGADGRVYLVADALAAHAARLGLPLDLYARAKWFHEQGHRGFDRLFPSAGARDAARRLTRRGLGDAWLRRHLPQYFPADFAKLPQDRRDALLDLAAEEALTHLAERAATTGTADFTPPQRTLWDRVRQWLYAALRRLRVDPRAYTDQEIADLVRSLVAAPAAAAADMPADSSSAADPAADLRHSLPERDREYLAAVEAGDMQTAQRMVDTAAKAAGYTVGPVWHGSIEKFTKFDTADRRLQDSKNALGDNIGAFFSTSKSVAKDFASRGASKQTRTAYQLAYSDGSASVGSPFPTRREAQEMADQLGAERFVVKETVVNVPAKEFPSRVYSTYLALRNPRVFADQQSFRQALTAGGRQTMEAQGHDGVVISDPGYDSDTWYVAFDPSQIKSADPVTRDDQGAVIPLSRRFDPAQDDIRFSLPERDREYLAAVEAGDMQTAQRMVDAAAKADLPKSIFKALSSQYADGQDITDDWKASTREQRQKWVEGGLHIETDRSGQRVVGTRASWVGAEILRAKVGKKPTKALLSPATYDAAGAVIPLSRRFDPAQDDIRFSLPERDREQMAVRFRQIVGTWQPSTDPKKWEAWKAEHPEEYAELEMMRADELKKQGYTIGPVWHGTSMAGLTTFYGGWWSDQEKTTREFGRQRYEGYLRGPLADGEQLRELYREWNGTDIDPETDSPLADYEIADAAMSGGPFSRFVREKGVQGISVWDESNAVTGMAYSVFDPSRIKSAQVAPDDTGSIPPPSEWGNPQSDDIRFSLPERQTAPGDLPDRLSRATLLTSGRALKAMPGYDPAKLQGDDDAAMRIARAIVKPARVEEIRAALDPERPVYVVPVVNQEPGGTAENKIPVALAHVLSDRLGAKFVGDVAKQKTGATRKTLDERAQAVNDYDGAVPAGGQFVLVDDMLTTGNTLYGLYDHIAAEGGDVRAIVAAAASRWGARLRPGPEDFARLHQATGLTSAQVAAILGRDEKFLTNLEIASFVGSGKPGAATFADRFGTEGQRQGVVPEVGHQHVGAAGQDGNARSGAAPELAPGDPADSADADSAPRHSLAGPLAESDIDAYIEMESIPGDQRQAAANQIRETFDYVASEKAQTPYLPGLEAQPPTRPAGSPLRPSPAAAASMHGRAGHSPAPRQPRLSDGPGVDADAAAAAQSLRLADQYDGLALRDALDRRGHVSSIVRDLVTRDIPTLSFVGQTVASPADLAALLLPLRSPFFESLKLIFLDDDGRVSHATVLTATTADRTAAHPRDALLAIEDARRRGIPGRRVVVAHNHPSGDPAPSADDIAMTGKFQRAIGAAGYVLHDHIITNGASFAHLAPSGNWQVETIHRPPPRPAWEAVPREDLPRFHGPVDLGRLMDMLRGGDYGHFAWVGTKNQILGIDRFPLGGQAGTSSLSRAFSQGVAREAPVRLFVDLGPLSGHQAARTLLAVKTLAESASIPLLDASTHDTPSYNAAGMLNESPAEYGDPDSAADPRHALPAPAGRPDLANPAASPEVRSLVDTVDQARNQQGLPERRGWEQWSRAAADLLSTPHKRDVFWSDLVEGKQALDRPELVLAARQLVDDRGMAAIRRGDPRETLAVARAIWQYRETRSDAARALAAGRDWQMTPEQRIRSMVFEAVSMPSSDLMRELDKARRDGDLRAESKTSQKIETQRMRMVAALRALGYDPYNLPADVLADRDSAAEIVRQVAAAKASGWDKTHEYWISSILSAWPTQAANIVGNAANILAEYTAQRFVEALVASSSRLFGARMEGAATLGELKFGYGHIMRGVAEGGRAAAAAYRTEQPQLAGSKFEERRGSIGGEFGRLIRIPLRGLLAADEFFKGIVYRGEMAAQAYRQAVGEGLAGSQAEDRAEQLMAQPSPELRAKAFEQALRMTFQQRPGTIAKGVLELRQKVPGVRWILPFVTTPANIFRTGFAKTPLGSGAMLLHAARGDYRGDASRLVHDIAEQALAWGLTALLYSLVGGGDDDELPHITGTMPTTRRSGERAARYANLPPQSIRIGDRWYSYKRIEPMATGLVFMVDALQAIRDARAGMDIGEALSRVLESAKAQMSDKTFMQGIGDIVKMFERGPQGNRTFVNYAENFASSFMPNAVRSTLRAADPVRREPHLGQGLAGGAQAFGLNVLAGALPLADAPWGQSPRLDYWGRPAEKAGGFGPKTDFLYRLLIPIDTQRVVSPTTVDRTLFNWQRIQETSGDPEEIWWPSVPRPEFSLDGVAYELTPDEHARWLRESGEYVLRMAERRSWDPGNPTRRDVDRIRAWFDAGRERLKRRIVLDRRKATSR
jgi:hypothetical protein